MIANRTEGNRLTSSTYESCLKAYVDSAIQRQKRKNRRMLRLFLERKRLLIKKELTFLGVDCRRGQGEGSPPENVQLIDLPKVVVTGSERHFTFQGHGCNPDVVLRNGRTLYLERLGDPRIDVSSRHIRGTTPLQFREIRPPSRD